MTAACLARATNMLAAAALVTAGCTPAFRDCAPIAPAAIAELPDRLSETGLFRDVASETLAPGVRPFTPRFPLWTDGATKRRWIYLPPGTRIDTRDPDAWNFPAGTRLWKEITRDGVRVETRMLYKHAAEPDAWTPLAYVWRDHDDAWATPAGLSNARGTPHDVPAAGDCVGCHGGVPGGVLGFSAIQLPRRGAPGELGLDELAATGLVSDPLPPSDLPGDATTQAALGYLHANCSHCHNQVRPARLGPRCFDPERAFSFQLRTTDLAAPEATAVYRTAIGRVIAAGDPDGSEILDRMRSRDPWGGMPALGSERVDRAGVERIAAWIAALRPAGQ
jgi:hypothetical protein